MQLQFPFERPDVWRNNRALSKIYVKKIIDLMYPDFDLDFAPPTIGACWNNCERGLEKANLVHWGEYTQNPCLKDAQNFYIWISTSDNVQKIPFLAHEVGHYLHYWAQPERVKEHLANNARLPDDKCRQGEYVYCELIAELCAKYAESRILQGMYGGSSCCCGSLTDSPIEDEAIELFYKRKSLKELLNQLPHRNKLQGITLKGE